MVITHGSAIIVSRNLKPKRTAFVAGLGRLHVLLVVAEEAEHEDERLFQSNSRIFWLVSEFFDTSDF